MTYSFDGQQYIAVAAGSNILAFEIADVSEPTVTSRTWLASGEK